MGNGTTRTQLSFQAISLEHLANATGRSELTPNGVSYFSLGSAKRHPRFVEDQTRVRRRRYTNLCNAFGVRVMLSSASQGGAAAPLTLG